MHIFVYICYYFKWFAGNMKLQYNISLCGYWQWNERNWKKKKVKIFNIGLSLLFPIDTARVLVQGSPVNLSCNVTDVSATIWLFGLTSESGDTVIAQGSVVYEKFSSQYELQVHSQENQYEMVLTVQNVNEDGIYTCQENGINKLQAHVTVESKMTS